MLRLKDNGLGTRNRQQTRNVKDSEPSQTDEEFIQLPE